MNIIDIQDTEQWDAIVKSFKNYDVYYLSGYVKAFQLNGDGEPILLYFEGDGIRAINVVMRRDIGKFTKLSQSVAENTYFDFITPYGYGGFLIEGNNLKQLEQEYTNYCREHHIVSEFVRFHPLLENYKNLNNMYDETCLGQTIAIDVHSPGKIWDNFSSKNRNMVRKAKKLGLEVYWTRDVSIIDEFMEIYNATMDNDSAANYYYFNRSFYESILNDLKYNAMWFYTIANQQIAAIAIFLFENGKMHYHLSASRKEYQHMAPTNLLLYEAALWANHNGYNVLHLGGGLGASCDSLYSFKKGFNRYSDCHFYIGKKIFCKDIYEELVNNRKMKVDFDKDSSFFPLYRAE